MSVALQLFLTYISGWVAIGIYKKQDRWALIFTYWCILSLKNIIDLFTMC